MTLTIILLVVVIGGFVLIGYNLNKSKSVTKDNAMREGQKLRHSNKSDSH